MNLNRMRIGTRLGGGFAVILTLAALMSLIGVWQLQKLADDSRGIMAVPLAKERLVEEWVRLLSVGVMRSTAIAKSSDPNLEAYFAETSKTSIARGDEVTKALQAMPSDAQEQALMAAALEQQTRYRAVRSAVMQAKRDGKAEEAERLFAGEFSAQAKAFSASTQAVLDQQRRAIDAASKAIDADTRRDVIGLGVIGALCIGLGALFAWLLTRSITRPLASAGRVADAVSGGDLSPLAPAEGNDELAALMRSLGSMTDNLRRMVQQVRESAESILVASSEVASGNADLSNRTEQTATNLQQTAASVEEITGTVKQSAASAQQASQLAAAAADVAGRGGSVVSQVVSTMDEINSRSKKIADIIGTIDGIAFQTNILALNAAVEAARAGEQGRGFAVVAGEVRSLAQRSAEAAREIKSLIGSSVEKVESGSRLVADAGSTMKEIVASVQRVSDIVGEISAAASEQSIGIGQVNDSVAQLDQMTQQNAALVEESAAAAESLRDQSRQLAAAVAGFRLQPGAAAAPVARAVIGQVQAKAARDAGKPAAAAPRAPAPVAKAAPASAAPKAVPAPTPKPAAPRAPAAPAAANNNDGDWESF